MVDDESKIVQLARDYLEHSGFRVIAAGDGRAAIAAARAEKPDLVVLDLGLPALNGLDVARVLRRESRVPIIMLTARADESDKLVGLELGADDYITKPFSPKELVARVRAVLRRMENADAGAETIRAADVTLDMARRRVTAGERSVDLTATEFQLLAALARQPGACSPARSSSMRCAAWHSNRTNGPSMRTSRTCAGSWSPIRASRAIC